MEWMNISAEFTKLPGVFGASSKYGWHIHSTGTTWEYVRNANSWAHPGPTESESPGLGTAVGVLTSFPGILRSPEPSETMRSRTIDLL